MIELLKKIFKGNSKFFKNQRRYRSAIRTLRKQHLNSNKIKVAFLVVFDSVFPAKPIFEKMLDDAVFEPVIIVVPNVSRTMKYQIDTLKKLLPDYHRYIRVKLLRHTIMTPILIWI